MLVPKMSDRLNPHFRRVVDALVLVAPFCILSRYEDGLRHCVEASVSGAAELVRRRITARPIPCAAIATIDSSPASFTIGLTPRQLYDRAAFPEGARPDFEAWKSMHAAGVPDVEAPMHEVIDARFAGQRALIDLTIGQLRQTKMEGADGIPLCAVAIGDGWPTARADGWSVTYEAPPHAPAVVAASNAQVKRYKNTAFEADLHDLVELALHLNVDRTRVHAEMRNQNPDGFAEVMARMAQLSA